MPTNAKVLTIFLLAGATLAYAADDLTPLSDEFNDAATLSNFQRIYQVEQWPANQCQTIDINTTQAGKLVMIPHTSTWYQDYRGELTFKNVAGDFIVTTDVTASNRAGTGAPSSNYSLGGILIRTPRQVTPQTWTPGHENYVFLSLGAANTPGTFQYEAKTTVNSVTNLDISPGTNRSVIQVARIGQYLIELIRPEGGAWSVRQRFTRADFPATLQVGLTVYTDFNTCSNYQPLAHNNTVIAGGNPDLVAAFDYIRYQRPTVPANLQGLNLANSFEVSDAQLLSFLGANTNPPPVATSISVTPSNASAVVNATQQFTAMARDQYGNPLGSQPAFTWSVTGGGTINSAGLFSATTAGGPFTVTASSGNLQGNTQFSVTLAPPVLATIGVTPPSASAVVGGTRQFTATGIDQYGNPLVAQPAITWSTSGGGTIDSTGLFTANAAGGPFTIMAASGNLQGTAQLTVTLPPPVLTSIAVAPGNVSVTVGDTQQFTASAIDQYGSPLAAQPAIAWSVNGGGTIDSAGLFTANAAGGPFTITAASGNVEGTAQISVTLAPPVLTTIAVTPFSASIIVGATQQFTATGIDQYGNPLSTQPAITWSSSGGGTIDCTGLFTANTAGGPFTITAANGNVQGTALITVTLAPPVLNSIVVTPACASIVAGSSQQFTATGFDQYGNPLAAQPAFAWSVTGGGTVNATGAFVANIEGGPFTITAESNAFHGTAQISVYKQIALLSRPAATPNPTTVGHEVQFSAAADATGTVSYAWDFGDGNLGSGATPTHAYAAPGVFTAAVTISDNFGQHFIGTVAITVNAANPDTPALTLTRLKAAAKLNFARGNNDTLSISGLLPDWQPGSTLGGKAVSLDVGGVAATFTLNARGNGRNPQGALKLNGRTRGFSAKLTKGSFAGAWSDEGVASGTTVKNAAMSIVVTLTLDGTLYKGMIDGRYSSRAGKSGAFKSNRN